MNNFITGNVLVLYGRTWDASGRRVSIEADRIDDPLGKGRKASRADKPTVSQAAVEPILMIIDGYRAFYTCL